MTEPLPINAAPPKSSWRTWCFVLGILFVACLAISHQSLWIDEADSALKSEQTSLANWWHEMLRVKGSDLQMPLYMIWIWVCGKIVGSSEIALRAVNLLWFVPGLFLLWRSLARQPSLQVCIFLTTIFSPFVWYYLDEARPYAMQIGAGLALLAVIIHWNENASVPDKGEFIWVCSFAAAIVVLCGTSLLGVIWAGAAVLAAVFLLCMNRKRQIEQSSRAFPLTPNPSPPRGRGKIMSCAGSEPLADVASHPQSLSPTGQWKESQQLARLTLNFIAVWLLVLFFLIVLGVYYLWTLKSGARASDVGTTDWKNAVFIAYELLGFAGLGPGRLEIRDNGLSVFKPYLLQLALFAAVNLAIFYFALQGFLEKRSRKKFLVLLVIAAIPVLFLLAAGVSLHFRVLGRHCAPLSSPIAFVLGYGLLALWRRGFAGKTISAAFIFLCLVSSFELRFAARHDRDDYRDAAALAKAALARRQIIWWNADENGALYYHLPVTANALAPNAAIFIGNPSSESLTPLTEPDMVCCSRPDIYDAHGALAQYLAQKHFQISTTLPAFVIWTRPAAQ